MERRSEDPATVPRGTFLTPPSPALEALLAEGLSELRTLETPVEALRLLAELTVLLARWSEHLNLTGHRGEEAIARRLILDAAALASVLPEATSIADLGSGAGLPGLPLAILRPAARVTLVEARLRRHHFQREAIRSLGVENVEARLGRSERLDPTPHDLVVAQAMARPETALAWMAAWARAGGHLALPMQADAAAPQPPSSVRPWRVVSYRVPLGGPERSIWIGVVDLDR